MNDAEHITTDDRIICPAVEELVLDYCAAGRPDLAFEVEYHDLLDTLTKDWLVREKITTLQAREMYFKLRSEWSARRKIDPSVWSAGSFVQ